MQTLTKLSEYFTTFLLDNLEVIGNEFETPGLMERSRNDARGAD